ncbi:MAG TPA: alpha-glucosidase C-terminal domain-containing protein, partial [Anaerolineae bacterium]|nr:alpha-glucosidase C-terminal domain-containing protein [Anaerolineae bacterium]
GDNIWLEDRNGVRTPMQWSGAANAGFSTGETEELYAPVIDDETYSYRHVNVEAQQDDPGSLLNWMRKAIRARKAQKALGQGVVQFLEPENRTVLAYLRSSGEETILAVNNLSAEPQSVELDLAEFAGRVPVDVLSGERLAGVTENSYKIALDRYGYRWLEL